VQDRSDARLVVVVSVEAVVVARTARMVTTETMIVVVRSDAHRPQLPLPTTRMMTTKTKRKNKARVRMMIRAIVREKRIMFG
jgi:hypothetical protein